MVDWRFISLWILNEENTQEWYTPEYRAGHYRGHRALRIADQIGSPTPTREAVGRWYTALGEALHAGSAEMRHAADNEAFLAAVLARSRLRCRRSSRMPRRPVTTSTCEPTPNSRSAEPDPTWGRRSSRSGRVPTGRAASSAR